MSTRTERKRNRKQGRANRRLRLVKGLASTNLHYFKRTSVWGTITNSNSLSVETNLQFSLNQMPNYAEITALFDQYRIKNVIVKFIPTSSDTIPNGNISTMIAPYIVTAVDYDDVNNISTPPFEYIGCKTNSMKSGFTRKLKPRPAIELFATAVTVGYGVAPKNMWLGCSSSQLPHYGLRTYIQNTSASTFSYQVLVTYEIECKNTR